MKPAIVNLLCHLKKWNAKVSIKEEIRHYDSQTEIRWTEPQPIDDELSQRILKDMNINQISITINL